MLPGRSGSCSRPSALDPVERTEAKKASTKKKPSVTNTDGVTLSMGISITPIPSEAPTISLRRGNRRVSRSVFSDATRNTTDPAASSTPTVVSDTP